jgi:hypothetical protein
MLSLDDPRWTTLKGGYRTPFDPRPLLKKLHYGDNDEPTWRELWDELHHQGDVGESSYAAVPLIVQAGRNRNVLNWNFYAIVAIIELARTAPGNPEVPTWLAEDYYPAIQELSLIGNRQLAQATDADTVRSILSVIALAKGLRMHAKFLIEYSDDELREIESKL